MTDWTLAPIPTNDPIRRFAVAHGNAPCPRPDWFAALAHDAGARQALMDALRAAPFAAYFWETPPMARGSSAAAELAIIDSPALAAVSADASAFAQAFASGRDIATFANLGGDSVLVAPHPKSARGAAHLAAFVRSAGDPVVHSLLAAVGDAASTWLASRVEPLWVSTSGLAVHWLHVRLDARPKYYSYAPYRAAP